VVQAPLALHQVSLVVALIGRAVVLAHASQVIIGYYSGILVLVYWYCVLVMPKKKKHNKKNGLGFRVI
jgi:hypothetical protein